MSKIVQQIQHRFKYFQIFIFILSIYSIFSLVIRELIKGNIIQNIPLGIFESLLSTIFSVLYFIFYGMLTHGIYNFLLKFKETTVNPTNAVWSIFIPFASEILVSLNAKKGFESLKLNNQITTQYLNYSIFSLIFIFGLFGLDLYLIFSQGLAVKKSLPIANPFTNNSFFISLIITLLLIASHYFVWKIMTEMKNAIVADSSEQV